MPSNSAKRLHDVKKLSEILPTGGEGGKEFSRIIDLLLFHQARRKNTVLTLFDDRAGDFNGLDALEKTNNKQFIGYQHKFFSSPLSDQHRSEIKAALKKAASKNNEDKVSISRWILVTPDDFVESAKRKDGGDVTWFQGLKKQLSLPFEIEHWGHKQIMALFLESPVLGLYYYPELFPDGTQRRKTIDEIRSCYDRAYRSQYERIEFVGMSVYKEDSTKGIPMENIYIPLNLVPYSSDDNDGDAPVLNPIQYLKSGMTTIFLGDPGSGKTTLLKFLGLLGQSERLNKKYGMEPERSFKKDERLPIFITLRRFADALKKDDTLCLVDYIRNSVEGDFSIANVPIEFIEYYLETGNAILLFDGMDELPNPAFKKKIRDRIQALCQSYPGNTIIVTSRIFGYGGSFRFDENQFGHYRIAKLGMNEIEQFIHDWYASRIPKTKQRNDHIESLINILRNEDHDAIRTLASNPLLLTIITLVHRIDAVLPDERVVLYEKCTETLMNTWHTWKYHDQDRLHKAKVDRLNRQRMQAIAHWMHHEAGRDDKSGQAVVPYKKLHSFLSKFISKETHNNHEFDPQDIAQDFIEFVQDRAGLLIEIGDRQFSFVHLTFQEFLTADRIKTLSEFGGVSKAWNKEVKDHCSDPRWHEVIRLLVARYDSDESQDYLIQRLFGIDETDIVNALLLGGLLLDGLAAMEVRKDEVLKRIYLASSLTDNDILHKPALNMLKNCLKKNHSNKDVLENQVKCLCQNHVMKANALSFKLTAITLGFSLEKVALICPVDSKEDEYFLNLFFGTNVKNCFLSEDESHSILSALQNLLMTSSDSNLASQLMKCLFYSLDLHKEGFEFFCGLSTMIGGRLAGPFSDYFLNEFLFFDQALNRNQAQVLARDRDRDLDRARALALALARARDLDRARDRARDRALALDRDLALALALDLDRDLALARARVALKINSSNCSDIVDNNFFWETFLSQANVENRLSMMFQSLFGLSPALQWKEAIIKSFLPIIPDRMIVMRKAYRGQIIKAFKEDQVTNEYVYSAAYLLIYDTWLWMVECYKNPYESPFIELASLTEHRKEAALQIAHCIRDLAFGKESRIEDLLTMVNSDDPEFRDIFVLSCWLPTEEEKLREQQQLKNKKKK